MKISDGAIHIHGKQGTITLAISFNWHRAEHEWPKHESKVLCSLSEGAYCPKFVIGIINNWTSDIGEEFEHLDTEKMAYDRSVINHWILLDDIPLP